MSATAVLVKSSFALASGDSEKLAGAIEHSNGDEGY